MSAYRAAVIVLSDRAAAGTRPDGCIPVVREILGAAFTVTDERILPDEPAALQAALIELADSGMPLVITSGGTGLGLRDRTPQATAAVLDYEIPGMGEAMRAASAKFIQTAMLSRAIFTPLDRLSALSATTKAAAALASTTFAWGISSPDSTLWMISALSAAFSIRNSAI